MLPSAATENVSAPRSRSRCLLVFVRALHDDRARHRRVSCATAYELGFGKMRTRCEPSMSRHTICAATRTEHLPPPGPWACRARRAGTSEARKTRGLVLITQRRQNASSEGAGGLKGSATCFDSCAAEGAHGVAIWVAVQLRAASSTQDRSRTLVRPEPIRTTVPRAANAA